MKSTTRLLILALLSTLIPMIFLTFILRAEISESILKEKREKLFGLARQLDTHLEGSFDDILREEGALGASRERKIEVLNVRLRDITDVVASGNEGVGVGYYSRDLDAVLTYGPSAELGYTVGQSIFPGHQGYEVMAKGEPMVQSGPLVRGEILNCMWPIAREGRTIGYIWSNETLEQVEAQLEPIIKRVQIANALIFLFIYASVTLTTKSLLDKVSRIKKGIEVLFHTPSHRIPPVSGELAIIVDTVNELMENMDVMRSYNRSILEEKERAAALGSMALGVVHELRNPLTSVKGFTQLLHRPDVTEAKRASYLGLIETELNRMDRLLGEMLVFGGRSRLERKPRDLLLLARDAVSRNDWNDLVGCPVVRAKEGGDYVAEVDEFKAGQVLDNILKNACEAVAAKGSGRVAVLVEDAGPTVRLRVVDTGVGIREEDLDRIGAPLYTTKPNGTGFGLPISRKLMEAHGGTLSLRSRFGYYTVVSLEFPKEAG